MLMLSCRKSSISEVSELPNYLTGLSKLNTFHHMSSNGKCTLRRSSGCVCEHAKEGVGVGRKSTNSSLKLKSMIMDMGNS